MALRLSLSKELSMALDGFYDVDWTFANAKTNVGIHSIHPYPARFIPHIPEHLIELFHPIVGGPVLDPFCGSGTTLVEAQGRGIASFGIDLNPIAALISRVKTDPPKREIKSIASSLVSKAERTFTQLPTDIPRLEHWFSPGSIRALSKITPLIAEILDRSVRDALKVALSRIIVRVSLQESDTRYAAVNRRVLESDVYGQFIQSAEKLDGIFQRVRADMIRRWAPSGVLVKDVLSVEPNELPYKFGLVVTSPPYPNAYEYWLYHKYRMYWLGEDPIEVRDAEIGARPNYFRKNPDTPEDFRLQMSHCFDLFSKVTLPLSIVCMVIGRSIIHGNIIDNAELIRSAANENGFHLIGSAGRQIPSSRKAFNPKHGTINTETVLVFLRT